MEQINEYKGVREKVLKSCQEINSILKSSLGPVGFDKIIIDNLGEIIITNDGAKISNTLKQKDHFSHLFLDVALRQDRQVGDGTTSVVLVAVELLHRGLKLLNDNIHPSLIISSYRLAMSFCTFLIRKKLSVKIKSKQSSKLLAVAMTCLQSKISGLNCRKFAKIAVEAVLSVSMAKKKEAQFKSQIGLIKYVKIEGQNISSSRMIDGIILENTNFLNKNITRVSPVKFLFLSNSLSKNEIMGQNSSHINELEKMWIQMSSHQKLITEWCKTCLQIGVNLIISTKGIDDFHSKKLCKEGCLIVRRILVDDMKKFTLLSGGKTMTNQHSRNFGKNFQNNIGESEEAFEQHLNRSKLLVIRGFKLSPGACIMIRGSTEYILNEVVRSLHDAIHGVMNTFEGKRVVPGGASVETNLSVELEKLANSISSKEQLPLIEYSESLLIVAKCLIANSGFNSTEMLSKLRLVHTASLNNKYQRLRRCGLDLPNGLIRDNFNSGILEPAQSKISCLQIATEAAITILRVDDVIS